MVVHKRMLFHLTRPRHIFEPITSSNLKAMEEKPGFIFGRFFGGLKDFVPRLDNVTDDPRYSRLLTDFSSVGRNVIFTVRFLEKKGLLTFLAF